jgi:hypothetical protein
VLDKLYRRAEALDGACLRALGHPHDYAIRQELLDALDWDSSVRPDHAPPVIRERFVEVHHYSVDLAKRIRTSVSGPDRVAQLISHSVQALRHSLAALMHVLEAQRADLNKS